MNDTFNSALSVQEGIEQPSEVNPYLTKRQPKRELTADECVEGILRGDRVVLSRAITLIESTKPEHYAKGQEVIERCLPHSGNSIRIGITGVPGAGKSTFIESFGTYLTTQGHKVAVLAIDPSSERSKGSILGDKTRMESLSVNPKAFIRPTPSGLTLGGVARKTRETIILCEAAGFDTILVETVGVGQSETIVKSMTDFFLLLLIAGAGDELQGIKRGIMEMADAIVITKADGDNQLKAQQARNQYQSVINLFPANDNGWKVPVTTCSVYDQPSIIAISDLINRFAEETRANGSFHLQRNQQLVKSFYEWIDFSIKSRFYENKEVKQLIEKLLPQIQSGHITPYQAGHQILENH
ncbi:MAG: methylmalonyl Co-A mutase-associated GTPase MeaB [Bacteroidales bacterium]|nr:methylmalonyl Co-A mutase-associated GTPase MeaB [Bacteroidales bacterium]